MEDKIYWVVENEQGVITLGICCSEDYPILYKTRREASNYCPTGYKPVKVKLVKQNKN